MPCRNAADDYLGMAAWQQLSVNTRCAHEHHLEVLAGHQVIAVRRSEYGASCIFNSPPPDSMPAEMVDTAVRGIAFVTSLSSCPRRAFASCKAVQDEHRDNNELFEYTSGRWMYMNQTVDHAPIS